jgi:hypothetical protein
MVDGHARHVGGGRQQIVHVGARLELARLVVDDLFQQCTADAQRHRALDLALDDHRVDEPSRVVAGPVAEDADERGERIHLDEGDVGAR